jgi:hypothetical protein
MFDDFYQRTLTLSHIRMRERGQDSKGTVSVSTPVI